MFPLNPATTVLTAIFTGAGNGLIFLNGIKKGQKTILIDDLLSSGGTAMALIQAIYNGGATVKQCLFVAEKVLMLGRSKIEDKYATSIISLVKFEAESGFTKDVTCG